MKRIVILGAGESGAGAAVLAKKEGFDVFVSDMSKIADKYKKVLDDHQIEWEEGHHTEEKILNADEIIKSPGIPETAPMVKKATDKGIHIISEIEFAGRYTNSKMICITGSNGKTTTTSLIYHIFKEAGYDVGLAGNIGNSLALQVAEEPHEYYVIELSSFQLDNMYDFRANIAVLLNITPDHLNRHYTMQNYAAIKERIGVNQTKNETCVLNYEDPYLRPYGEHLCPARVVWFSSQTKLREGYYLDGDDICRADGKGGVDKLMNVNDMQLVGLCNAENVMAAIAITEAAGVPMDMILSVIREFPPVPHRIEFVGEKGGVKYYNDSKATNPDAAIQGIRAMKGPTVLIGGGYDKKNSYDEWIEAFDGKVKKLVLIGQTRDDIAACARAHGFTEILFCDTFEECMKTCTSLAGPGEEVLLSPACASWGMFPNYEVRGDIFREYVRNLPE